MEKWKKAQQYELKFWKSLWRKGKMFPKDSLFRFKICIDLLPKINVGAYVLDVGSGPNRGILPFLQREFLKIACDPLLIHKQGAVREDNCIAGVGEYLPLKDDTFDVAFNINSLDHSYSPERIIKEIYRVLKEQGYLILMVHTVSLAEKVAYYIIHKMPSFLLHLWSEDSTISSRLRFTLPSPIFRFLEAIFGYNLIRASFLHPYQFRRKALETLLEKNGIKIIKKLMLPSFSSRQKTQLFLVALKPFLSARNHRGRMN